MGVDLSQQYGPTPAAGDASTKYATTAFVKNALGVVVASTLASTVTAYTLALTDAGTTVETTASSAVTVTVPLNASVAFPARTIIAVRQYGPGQITIAGASGVTLRQTSSLTSRSQYSTIYLEYRGGDEWIVDGGTT